MQSGKLILVMLALLVFSVEEYHAAGTIEEISISSPKRLQKREVRSIYGPGYGAGGRLQRSLRHAPRGYERGRLQRSLRHAKQENRRVSVGRL